MVSGIYICSVCEREGKPPGKRFKVPADEIEVSLMEQHLSDQHRLPDARTTRPEEAQP